MQGSVSAAVRVDCRPALSHYTALETPQWWITTSKNLWTVPASGTKSNESITNEEKV